MDRLVSRRGQAGTLSGDTEPLDVQTARHEAPNPTQDSPHGSARIMDMNKVAAEVTHYDDEAEVTLYDAHGEPEVDSAGQPVKVWVVSAYSAAARTQQQIAKSAIRRLINRFGTWDKVPQAESDVLENQRIAACMTRWQGFEDNGTPFPFTPENAAAVIAGLRAKRVEQLAQVEGAIAQHASFFQKPSAS